MRNCEDHQKQMGCLNSKPADKEKQPPKTENKPAKTENKPAENKPAENKPAKTENKPAENKPAEGTHVPKPKGDKPVIEDRPNGKKEVVSGDKSILIDEIYNKHNAKLEAKRKEVEDAKQAWLAAKEKNAPNKNELAQKFQDLKKEMEDVKAKVTHDIFNEVNIYMPEEDAIDLHGLLIEGAMMMAFEEIDKRRKAGKKIVKIQCGMGHHNTVGYSKIKEELVKQLKEKGEKFTEDKEHGFVNVDL